MRIKIAVIVVTLMLGASVASADVTKSGDDASFSAAVDDTTLVGVRLNPSKLTVMHFESEIRHVQLPDFEALDWEQTAHYIKLRPQSLPPNTAILGNFTVETKAGTVVVLMFPSSPADANSVVRIDRADLLAARKAGIEAEAAMQCADMRTALERTNEQLRRDHQRELAEQERLAALDGTVANDPEIPVLDAETIVPQGIAVRELKWSGKDAKPRLVVGLVLSGGVAFQPVRVTLTHATWSRPLSVPFGVYIDGVRHKGALPPGRLVEIAIDASKAAFYDDLGVTIQPEFASEVVVIRKLESRVTAAERRREALRQAREQAGRVRLRMAAGIGGVRTDAGGISSALSARFGYPLLRGLEVEGALWGSRQEARVGAGVFWSMATRVSPSLRVGVESALTDGPTPGLYVGAGLVIRIKGPFGFEASLTRGPGDDENAATALMVHVYRRWSP